MSHFLHCHILISQELYIISSTFLVHRSKIMISPGVFLYFFEKCNIVRIIFLTFLLAHFNSFLLINSCFSNSSMNAEQKFCDVPNLLHMCVIFQSFWVYHKDLLYVLSSLYFILATDQIIWHSLLNGKQLTIYYFSLLIMLTLQLMNENHI